MSEFLNYSPEEYEENSEISEEYDEAENYEDEDEYERADIREAEQKIRAIPLPEEFLERYEFLKELPDGVAVMGGVARSIAREIIAGDKEPMRDIDLVNITSENGDSLVSDEILDELAKKYMPDDYNFGHGIQNETLEHYFNTRDFTVNQSLILNGKLLVSDVAYNDFQENIIRPSYYELQDYDDNLKSRVALKALMMQAILAQTTTSVPLLEDINIDFISSFDEAVFLNKAMARGIEVATNFTEILVEWDITSEEYAGKPKELAIALLDNDIEGFEFRPAIDERFMDKQFGYYTQADYDEINVHVRPRTPEND